MESIFDPYAFLGKKLLENTKAFQQQSPKQEVTPFPLKGLDLATGVRDIDLNKNYFVEPDRTLPDAFALAAKTTVPETTFPETTDGKLPEVSPVSDLKEQLDVLTPYFDEQRQRDVDFYRQTAGIERAEQLAAAQQMFPLIDEASKRAFYRGLAGDVLSPTKQQKRALYAQTGEAGLMQAIANQAAGARQMTGSFRGKNIAIG